MLPATHRVRIRHNMAAENAAMYDDVAVEATTDQSHGNAMTNAVYDVTCPCGKDPCQCQSFAENVNMAMYATVCSD